MTIRICSDNEIEIDGVKTGLKVTQAEKRTIVYTPEGLGKRYKEHSMSSKRYSLAHDAPASGAAGRAKFESDIRMMLGKI